MTPGHPARPGQQPARTGAWGKVSAPHSYHCTFACHAPRIRCCNVFTHLTATNVDHPRSEAGTFAADAASATCTGCGAGTYTIETGATECLACNPADVVVDSGAGGVNGGACNGQGYCSPAEGICSCTNGEGGAQTGYQVSPDRLLAEPSARVYEGEGEAASY